VFSFIAAEKTSYAVAETFIATLKKELVNDSSFAEKQESHPALLRVVHSRG
jgi:hypothetical protein